MHQMRRGLRLQKARDGGNEEGRMQGGGYAAQRTHRRYDAMHDSEFGGLDAASGADAKHVRLETRAHRGHAVGADIARMAPGRDEGVFSCYQDNCFSHFATTARMLLTLASR